jgi:hypothetical protein
MVREPVRADVVWIPELAWEIRSPFVDVDMLNELCVKVRVPERAIGHKLVIEVARPVWVVLQTVKLGELCLGRDELDS